jgi:hypothetical protein
MSKVDSWWIIVGAVVFLAFVYWTKPDCIGVNVPMFSIGEGWVCVPGYKPPK